ncbi:hypothetical protein ABK040_004103 [Willaertia magna]
MTKTETSEKRLLDASFYGEIKVVRKLVEDKHAMINTFSHLGIFDSETPLFAAAFSGRTEVVKYLLEKGANLELGDKFVSSNRNSIPNYYEHTLD